MRARTNAIDKYAPIEKVDAIAKIDEYRKLDIFERAELYDMYASIVKDAGLEVYLLNCSDQIYNTIRKVGNPLEFKI